MSKNALALVDCSSRDVLFQYLVETFDRKASKNEMVSPYDDQLIGKMNFRYRNTEHSMFFTYARSSEYPGLRFQNRKIMYLSLGVNDISSDIFQQICTCFGGFINYNDDLDDGWQRIERVILEYDPWQEALKAANSAESEPLDVRPEMRQMLGMTEREDTVEESTDPKEVSQKESHKPERKRSNVHRVNSHDGEKRESAEKNEAKTEKSGGGKSERQEEQQRRPRNHYRGHGRPRGEKAGAKKTEGKQEQKPAEKKQKTKQEKTTGSLSQA